MNNTIVPPEAKAFCLHRGQPPEKKQSAEVRVVTYVSTRPRCGRPSILFDLTDYSTDPGHYTSSFTKQLVQNPTCLSKYTDDCFSIVTHERCRSNLNEALHIGHSAPN